ncbi:MAG: chondroitinase-B domain-containing protein, partial [Bacteroidia bacterium]
MMKRIFLLLSIFCLLIACRDTLSTNSLMVHDAAALQQAIETAKPGDEIILSNGIWKDLNIKFAAKGTKDQSITLRAETPGKVLIQGESNLRLGGEYLVVDGLHFSNGFSPQGSVIEFAINDKMIANHCRITNCVIEG